MSIYSVRILINTLVQRPCTHFRLLTKSSLVFNKPTASERYDRQLTKRESNLHKQFIQRHMATPIIDEKIEKDEINVNATDLSSLENNMIVVEILELLPRLLSSRMDSLATPVS